MKEQTLPAEWWRHLLTATKTRQEFLDAYEMKYKVFVNKLRYFGIDLPPGHITPKYQIEIYEALGPPPSFFMQKKKG